MFDLTLVALSFARFTSFWLCFALVGFSSCFLPFVFPVYVSFICIHLLAIVVKHQLFCLFHIYFLLFLRIIIRNCFTICLCSHFGLSANLCFFSFAFAFTLLFLQIVLLSFLFVVFVLYSTFFSFCFVFIMANFSGAVKIADLNDYLAPAQNCIKPMMKISEEDKQNGKTKVTLYTN